MWIKEQPATVLGKEHDLAESGLVSRRQAGNEARVCGVRMEEVDKQAEN